ncbi:hypothetical protein JIG36_12980 [Actinoplanes sp. LDG1-06]|uniref:DUF4034 domain-containing protein n=1 Tax=Paractinoplanes ovalisporus TaxID=2810368 RepID=A0ABS2A9F9_9ACTN|nr:hypothetical protein [Actinoplanes ovalisporus]MBM2616471.1 hypothetical protein [Actinoplanes ovalisporus]
MRFFKKKERPAGGADDIEIQDYWDDGSESLAEALEEQEWVSARKILAGADTDELMYYMSIVSDARGVEEWIPEVIRRDPDDPLPRLVRGARAISWAWDVRGTTTADQVPPDAWPVFFRRLALAEDSLDEALERDPTCAEAWHYKIILGRARQLPAEEEWRRFHHLIELNPSHYYGHKQMYEGLLPKWGGSWDEAFKFARVQSAANPGTHIPHLISMAHLDFRWEGDNEGSKYLGREEVSSEIYEAAWQSVWHDDYETTILTPNLWNSFAYTLTYGRYFKSACTLYNAIGDDFVRLFLWRSKERYVEMREWAREEAAEG